MEQNSWEMLQSKGSDFNYGIVCVLLNTVEHQLSVS